jgi:hypothetical protein
MGAVYGRGGFSWFAMGESCIKVAPSLSISTTVMSESTTYIYQTVSSLNLYPRHFEFADESAAGNNEKPHFRKHVPAASSLIELFLLLRGIFDIMDLRESSSSPRIVR